MSFEDRFSGRAVDALPAGVHHAGRWIVREADAAQINRISAHSPEALMPGPTGEWEVVEAGTEKPNIGQFFPDALPSDQDAEALRQLRESLRGASDDGWLAWGELNPLARGLDETVGPHPFEGRIEDGLPHLEAVCLRPRTHIRLEVERELVHRARRIARDASQWLAAHTEDWHRRTLTGVQPGRIRAEVREEDWDLYENRVAARLVDNLIVWLRRRHAEVRRITYDLLMRIEELEDTAHGGSRHRAKRIYDLWGEAWEAGCQEVAVGTLRRLERLLYKVLALQDSRLYRHVPTKAQVPRTLWMTNLLNTDDHYRGVASLWRHWSRLPARGTLSARMHYRRQQDTHESFDAWCMLLVIRACSQLKLVPANDDEWQMPLAKGCSVRMEKSLRVEWEASGAVSLGTTTDGGGTLCRFVPLLHSLESAKTARALAQRVAPLVDAVADQPHWTVVLHLAGPGDAPYKALATIGNPPQQGAVGAIDFIRVSPYALDCVERVARAVRWATLAPRLLDYPPSVSVLPDESVGRELRLECRNLEWTMNALPGDYRRAQRVISDRLDRARAQRESLQGQLDSARRERRDARQLLKDVDAAGRTVREWDAFKQDVDNAMAVLCELRACPGCGQNAELRELDERCFTARCESCQAVWGLHALPGGQGRVPVFDRDDGGAAAKPYEIDHLAGCDVLAVPSERGHHLVPRLDPVDPELKRLLER